jgi:hypothetical protein
MSLYVSVNVWLCLFVSVCVCMWLSVCVLQIPLQFSKYIMRSDNATQFCPVEFDIESEAWQGLLEDALREPSNDPRMAHLKNTMLHCATALAAISSRMGTEQLLEAEVLELGDQMARIQTEQTAVRLAYIRLCIFVCAFLCLCAYQYCLLFVPF